MASVRRTVPLPLQTAILCVLAIASVAATPGVAVGESLAATAAQDSSVVEASLALDRSTRRLIQQGLRNEGFDPGTPDGLFGPRTRAAIRDWQQSRGAPPTGFLSDAEAELLRTAAAPPPASPEATGRSAALPTASTPQADSNPPPVPVAAAVVDPQNADATNTQQRPRARAANGTVQLPPEILVDRHLLRVDRLLADDDYGAALAVMDEIDALQQQHDILLPEEFPFTYAEVALAAGLAESAIASANEYLVTAGRDGTFYRQALELLDTAEETLRRAEAGRRRAEAERRRAEAERRRAEARQREQDELVRRQVAAAAQPLPPDRLRSGGLGPEMIRIASGRFQYYRYLDNDDRIQWVEFDRPFAISKYEVTRGDFETFIDRSRYRTEARQNPGYGCSSYGEPPQRERGRRWDRPGFDQTARHPVTCVSIRDAVAYTRWLSQETGHAYRLPSAAEWQYTARAGSPEAQLHDLDNLNPNSRNSCGRANLDETDGGRNSITCRDGVRYTTEVGRFAPNSVGLHDMIGNVAELVLACSRTPDGAPENPEGCDPYVSVMGAAWYHAGTPESFSNYTTWARLYAQASRSRTSRGNWNYRRSSTTWVGFRVVREDVQGAPPQ